MKVKERGRGKMGMYNKEEVEEEEVEEVEEK